MPRVRSPNVDKAYSLYKKGYKLIEISKELNIPASTVRRWKKTYEWDNERPNNNERSLNKKNNKNIKEKSLKTETKKLLKNSELNDRQKLFCAYYIRCFNATKAYKKAYGCSYETAMTEGCNSLRNPKIKAMLDELRADKLNMILITEEDIFQRYLDIAYASITDYLEFGTKEINIGSKEEPKKVNSNYIYLKDSKELDGSVISEVKQGKSGISLKLHDPLKAMEWLSEHMNIATDKQKQELELLKANVEFIKARTEQLDSEGWN
ncbi:terminase small subunit [Clostridium perfringens]|uniref:terminase small subunit n=1 Tax=Clostridium perfringens TaxID=1502 RepID=UPI0013E322E6|nr:terminase small subunit [Clostridium perfringens]NGT65542.1 phage portal protein [Clostridium perfringens]WEV23424.1 terminase small subunit [Clostridium perfringens D]